MHKALDIQYMIKKKYEELHAEDSYEEGKKGVQVLIDPHKNNEYHRLDIETKNKLTNFKYKII